ncbi:hypothetical protein [Shewanella algae]|uniref:hypothetical protein n=1 Tax=Shewanella algae TaxID=38313 RepID=UPI001C57E3D5|nr:hypothetical protein [Shewanella algae]
MKKFLRAIYDNIDRLPNPILIFLMKLNFSAKLAFGKRYFYIYNGLKSGEYVFNNKRLFEMVNNSFRDIPYYKSKRAVNIETIEQFEKEIGFIDKDVVLENFEGFINPLIDISNFDRGTTGGTSGKPLKLIMDPNRYVIELATMHFLWSQVGYNFDTRAVIRNHKLKNNQCYTVNPITKEIIFDGFRLNDAYFEDVYSVLFRYKVKFVHCYPSTAYEFSKFLYHKKKDVSFIKSFLCGSENVVEYQRDFIVNKLNVNFFSFYGHSEKLAIAGSVVRPDGTVSRNYIFEPSYGYVELIDEDGNVIKETGKVGEIVGTTLNNSAMPLIRYRTGDFASYVSLSEVDSFGRSLPIFSPVLGRWAGDKIFNKDGSFVTTTALNLHSDVYEKINGIQYVQNRVGHLEILIIKGDGFSETVEKDILEHFVETLNDDSVVKITYVDHLIKKDNGKFLLLNSSLNI